MRGLAAGLGVMLVDEGGADGEGGGGTCSACNSVELQLVGVLRWDRCSGVAAVAGRDRTTGGARGRLGRVGMLGDLYRPPYTRPEHIFLFFLSFLFF